MAIYTSDEIASELLGHCDATAFSTEDANLITAAINRADSLIYSFLLRETGYTARTEVLTPVEPLDTSMLLGTPVSRMHQSVLNLTHRPVLASSLQVWANSSAQVFGADQLLVDADDYQLENVVGGFSNSGVLRRLGGASWPSGPGGVQVTYTCGLDLANAPKQWEMIRLAAFYTIREDLKRTKTFESFFNSATAGLLDEEQIGKYRRKANAEVGAEMLRESSGLPPSAIWALEPLISYGVWL